MTDQNDQPPGNVAAFPARKRSNPETDPRPPELSDDTLALRFAKLYRDQLRYVHARGAWYRYDGRRWAVDRSLFAYNCARIICRDAATSEDSKSVRATLGKASTVAAVVSLARSDRRLASTIELWDTDAWLLNTPDGTVELINGTMRSHDPLDMITKVTAASPSGDCPMFRRFLDQITDGNLELQAYLQRLFGYAATGSTREHIFGFFQGNGANGKSVLISVVSHVLGDYAHTSPMETFTASKFERHPTEIAMLHGARLVTATETEEGRDWAEARIKQLTGGDRVAARFMQQDFFEFHPVFKLVIAGNHKPGLRSVDEAIRRRLHLVPFNVTIPVVDRDPELVDKLMIEAPGILRWIVDGTRHWLANGLNPPRIVTAATDAYLDQQDAVAAWLADSCLIETSARERASELFANWQLWAKAACIPPGPRNALLDELRKRGFEDRHTKTGTMFYGLQIVPLMTGSYGNR